MPDTNADSASGPALHPDVLRPGLVTFPTDLSSEMIFSVFAVFFTSVAGASSALPGLIEGLADSPLRRGADLCIRTGGSLVR